METISPFDKTLRNVIIVYIKWHSISLLAIVTVKEVSTASMYSKRIERDCPFPRSEMRSQSIDFPFFSFFPLGLS